MDAKLLATLTETEALGDRFLDARQKAVGLDRRRQELREALTALRKQQQDGSSKGWVQLRGGPMVKMAVPQALEALQTEQASVEQELALVRAEEKRLMGMLAERGAGPQSCGPGVLHAMLSLGGSG